MIAQNLIPVKVLVAIHDEPRILDTELAQRLGLVYETNIRTTIAANRAELEAHGGLHVANVNPTHKGGRPSRAYYLNEAQALVICALSRTSKAAEIRKALIDVFMAYRAGKLVHVNEHHRKPPMRRKSVDSFSEILWSLRAYKNDPDALLEVLAHTIERVNALERKAAA